MTHTGEFVTLPPPGECMPDQWLHRFITLNQHVIEKISFFSLYDCGEPFMKLLRTAHPVHSFLPLVLAAFILPGCSGSSMSPSGAAVEPARAAVAKFLDAVKRGDDDAASGMLTEVARAKTRELGLSVAPPVSSSATYSIGACELVGENDDLVHVSTTWTDTDPDGFTSNDDIVWVVRLDPEGWRLAGMATKVFDDMAPLLLNFEDPEDMLSKQEMLAEEIQKRAQQVQTESVEGSPRSARTDQSAPKIE